MKFILLSFLLGTAGISANAGADHPQTALQLLAAENVARWDTTHDPIAYQNLLALHELFHVDAQRTDSKTDLLNDIQKIQSLLPTASFKISDFKSTELTSRIEPSTGANGNIMGGEFPQGTWSITFDDGPHASHTRDILKNLKSYNMSATFFEVAENVINHQLVSLDVQKAGHEMANHSFTHANLYKVTAKQLDDEITLATRREQEIWGDAPKLFRAPYGNGFRANVRAKIAENNMVHVFWNVDTLDWVTTETPQTIFARAKKEIDAAETKKTGGVILFHDIHLRSIEASRLVMQYMRDKKYRVMTVSKVIEELNSKLK